MPEPTDAAKVAALRILADRVAAERDAARTAAERKFKTLRDDLGVKSLDVVMPSGESAGSISIRGPKRTIAWHHAALADVVERTAPTELVESIDPAALEDVDLLAVLRETRPDLIRRTVRPAYLKELADLVSDEGTLIDQTTGEIAEVASVDIKPATGAFSFTPGPRAEEAVLEAWHRGELAGVGESLVPQIEQAEEPAPANEAAGPFPTGDQS